MAVAETVLNVYPGGQSRWAMDKDACHPAYWFVFDSQNPHGGKRDQLPGVVL